MVREGVQKEIEASELVLGDIVSIKGGDKTPADIRMLECHSIKVSCIDILFLKSLKVDNSSLTGESVPVSLRPDSSDPNHLESRNLAFYSTNVVEGTGTGLVIKTGDETVMGCIARLRQDSHQQGGELKLLSFVQTSLLSRSASLSTSSLPSPLPLVSSSS